MAGDNARLRYYRGSWAFVHFLHNGPAPIRALFQALIQKLDAGENIREAWRETLGKVPKAEIEQSFYTYVNAQSWTGTELPIHPAQPEPVARIVPLRDEEVHLLWARLADRSLPATDLRSQEAQIAEAERAAPSAPEVSYRLGCLALERKHADDATKYFEAALAVAPDEPRYLFGALEAFAAEQADGSRRPATRQAQSKDTAWRARLAATARTADQLSMVARILADGGEDEAALRYANAAIAADPSFYGAFASRAFVHFRKLRYADAVADQERAVGIAADGVDAAQLARILEAYRASLGARE
jgi:tetratricopeptide (TPR) repeat protein